MSFGFHVVNNIAVAPLVDDKCRQIFCASYTLITQFLKELKCGTWSFLKHAVTLFLRSSLLKSFITNKNHYQSIIAVDLYRIISNNITTAKTFRLLSKYSLAGSQLLFSAHISSLTPNLWFSTLCWLCPGKPSSFVTPHRLWYSWLVCQVAGWPSSIDILPSLFATGRSQPSPNASVWAHCSISHHPACSPWKGGVSYV